MGRESGFIAASASLARSDVNFCLIPEVPFGHGAVARELLRERLAEPRTRRHRGGRRAPARICMGGTARARRVGQRASFKDIGLFLQATGSTPTSRAWAWTATLKYIDPSYTIRSVPANAYDSAFCLLLGQNAVHAGMAGRTNMVVGYWMKTFTHVPIPLAVPRARRSTRTAGSGAAC